MKDIEEMNLSYIEISVTDARRAAYVLAEKLSLSNFKIMGDARIRIYDSSISTQELSKALTLNGVELTGLNRQSETLEDYFLKMTSEVAR